jgi:protein-disulfide isomerase
MHDALYENQDALEDEDLAGYAEDLDLDVPRLIREVEMGAYSERIRKDLSSGVRSGVNGTPSFFINDVHYVGQYDFGTMLSVLNEARENSRD